MDHLDGAAAGCLRASGRARGARRSPRPSACGNGPRRLRPPALRGVWRRRAIRAWASRDAAVGLVQPVAAFQAEVDAADHTRPADRRSRSFSRGGSAWGARGCRGHVRTRVPRQSSSMAPPDGGPASAGRAVAGRLPTRVTRTSTRSESSASRLRSTTGFEPRTSAKSGEKCQPDRCTCELAAARSACMRVATCSPSMSTSSEQSGRGGGSPGLQSPPSAASVPPCPSRASRRR